MEKDKCSRTEADANTSASDILRTIPRPQYPIRIFFGKPTPFCLETQRRKMIWKHPRHRPFHPKGKWLEELNIDDIRLVLGRILILLGHEAGERFSVEFLSSGSFNRVYTVQTPSKVYAFRVPLPIDPYFKTEADVATTELVRHFTGIPVPKIYAYESSADNALGLEWILMDKITAGKMLADSWTSLDLDQKTQMTRTIARWMSQLSKIRAKKIGSIYMRYSGDDKLDFFIGRSVNTLFTYDERLMYDVPRGPFSSLKEYYATYLAVAKRDVDRMDGFASVFSMSHQTLISDWPRLRNWTEHPELRKQYAEQETEQGIELKHLNRGISALQQALPALCAKIGDTRLSTRLSHLDLSERNILVDQHGTPVVILDWENIELLPRTFLSTPAFVSISKNRRLTSYFNHWNERIACIRDSEKLDEIAKWYHSREEYERRKHERPVLRRVYYEELKKLECPLVRVGWDHRPSFDRELCMRVWDSTTGAEGHIEWINSHLSDGAHIQDKVD